MKIHLKLNLPGCELVIEEVNHQQGLFEFLKQIFDLIAERKDLLFLKSDFSIIKEETTGVRQTPKISPDITPDIKDQPMINPNSENQEKINQISKDAKLPVEKIARIFDFGKDLPSPSLNVEIKGKSLSEKQRQGLLLLMYAYSLLNQQDKLTSQQLKILMEKSNINPKNLFNALPSGGSNLIKKEDLSYRITLEGKIAAKQLLKEYCDNLN